MDESFVGGMLRRFKDVGQKAVLDHINSLKAVGDQALYAGSTQYPLMARDLFEGRSVMRQTGNTNRFASLRGATPAPVPETVQDMLRAGPKPQEMTAGTGRPGRQSENIVVQMVGDPINLVPFAGPAAKVAAKGAGVVGKAGLKRLDDAIMSGERGTLSKMLLPVEPETIVPLSSKGKASAEQMAKAKLDEGFKAPPTPTPEKQNVGTLPSSLQKQSSIAATVEQAQRGGDPYQKGVYEQWGKEFPELIDLTGAQDYEQLQDAAYKQLIKETEGQFDQLKGTGLKINWHQGDKQYPNSQAMITDALRNKNLDVFQGGDIHPQLGQVDATGVSPNDKFRAVHDFYGHVGPNTSFGPVGEEGAYAAHSQMFSPLARLALASETRGQNSVVNYGPRNAEFLLKLKRGEPVDWNDFQFADNSGILMPPEQVKLMYAGDMSAAVRDLIEAQNPAKSGDLFHWSGKPLTQTDPKMFGTGIDAQEQARIRWGLNPVKERTSFYTDPNSREAGLGGFQHVGESDNFYPVDTDPEKLKPLSRAYNLTDQGQYLNDLERMMKERGYSGYATGRGAQAFDPVDVKPYNFGQPEEKIAAFDDVPSKLSDMVRNEDVSSPASRVTPKVTARGPDLDTEEGVAAFEAKYGRKPVHTMTREERVAKFGPAMDESPDVWASDIKSKRPINMPGGFEDGQLTLADQAKISAQAIDYNDLDPGMAQMIHAKLLRSVDPGENPSDLEFANRLGFGITSGNAPITKNLIEHAQLRPRSTAEMKEWADYSPVGVNEQMPSAARNELNKAINEGYGVQAAERGGTGTANTANRQYVSDLNKMILENPEFFRMKPGEQESQYVERLMNQVRGLGPKTGSLGFAMLSPQKSNISAIDRHIADLTREVIKANPETRKAYEQQMLNAFNLEQPKSKQAATYATALRRFGDGAESVEADKFRDIVSTPQSSKYRVAKTGEIRENVPEHLRNLPFYEPEFSQQIGPIYQTALKQMEEEGRPLGLKGFGNQWLKWDYKRSRAEPHAALNPMATEMERLTPEEYALVRDTFSGAGAMASKADPATGRLRPMRQTDDFRKMIYGQIDPELLGAIAAGSAGAAGLSGLLREAQPQ